MQDIHPIILCGGEGARLAPVSTPQKPKPFLPMLNGRSLLVQTLERVERLQLLGVSYMVGHHNFKPLMEAEIKASAYSHTPHIIAEPTAKGTAAAIALAALTVDHHHSQQRIQHDEPLLLVLPSDHLIRDETQWKDAIKHASHVAKKGDLVLFGAHAHHADSGYGYIHNSRIDAHGCCDVLGFEEKPNIDKAMAYITSGDYLWNMGMMLVKARVLIEYLDRLAPKFMGLMREAFQHHTQQKNMLIPSAKHWARLSHHSMDRLLLEKMPALKAVPVDAGWSDVGTWERLIAASRCDAQHVLSIGSERDYPHLTQASYYVGGDQQFILYRQDGKLYVSQREENKRIESSIKS